MAAFKLNLFSGIFPKVPESLLPERTATAYGTQALGPADPGNFTPFASLTSSQVQGWVEAQMGAELSACQADIARRINEVIAPTLVQRTPPW